MSGSPPRRVAFPVLLCRCHPVEFPPYKAFGVVFPDSLINPCRVSVSKRPSEGGDDLRIARQDY